jgi:hypothetical protein
MRARRPALSGQRSKALMARTAMRLSPQATPQRVCNATLADSSLRIARWRLERLLYLGIGRLLLGDRTVECCRQASQVGAGFSRHVVHDLTAPCVLRRIGKGPKGGGDLEAHADAHGGQPASPEAAAAPEEVAITAMSAAPRASRMSTRKASVHTGTRMAPPPRPVRAPNNPATSEPSQISSENSTICMDDRLHAC